MAAALSQEATSNLGKNLSRASRGSRSPDGASGVNSETTKTRSPRSGTRRSSPCAQIDGAASRGSLDHTGKVQTREKDASAAIGEVALDGALNDSPKLVQKTPLEGPTLAPAWGLLRSDLERAMCPLDALIPSTALDSGLNCSTNTGHGGSGGGSSALGSTFSASVSGGGGLLSADAALQIQFCLSHMLEISPPVSELDAGGDSVSSPAAALHPGMNRSYAHGRWPLLLDAHGQAIEWVRSIEARHALCTVHASAGGSDFVDTTELAMRQGLPLVVFINSEPVQGIRHAALGERPNPYHTLLESSSPPVKRVSLHLGLIPPYPRSLFLTRAHGLNNIARLASLLATGRMVSHENTAGEHTVVGDTAAAITTLVGMYLSFSLRGCFHMLASFLCHWFQWAAFCWPRVDQ